VTASDLLARSGFEAISIPDPNVEVRSVAADSRSPDLQGVLFACMPSARTDTHQFVRDALARGAIGALVHDPAWFERLSSEGVLVAYASKAGFLSALGRICRAFFPKVTGMRITGVTGTNGKTTTTWMIRQALDRLGRRAAYLGTLGLRYDGMARALENTTPFPVELWSMLDEAAGAGCTDFVMEVSSHGLEERRVAAVPFACGVFTNLSQDHLDYHSTMEAYEAAKFRLFDEYDEGGFVSVLNTDDPVGQKWVQRLAGKPLVTYGFESGDVRGEIVEVMLDSLALRLRIGEEEVLARLGVGGTFNARNALAAAACLYGLGYGLSDIAEGLAAVTPVPGRFEAVPNERGIGVIVDYAHTSDALEKLLASARELSPRRLIVVFGCGGDRDRSKRPRMAAAVSRWADRIVVTSDNPRTEDPLAIIADIEAGLDPGKPSESIADRREAIDRAIAIAESGDIVVIAGKGHEDYQIIGRVKHHMDDREMAREALSAARSGG
jgi:UDP-N-acetylmuramoyl-L-alanyl-D-glutamate--2,6-diaminopimelate ligase